jgi:sensor histidine kinase YesM
MASINFVLFYLVAFYLLPRIGIKEKRWIWLTAICIVLVLAFTFLKFRVENYRAERLLEKSKMFSPTNFTRKLPSKESLGFFSYRFRTYLQVNIYTTLSIIFIAFAYRLMLAWWLQEKIRKDLENQKLQAELSFLKMQVNPHFLFNALNNIYSLAVLEKSRKTGDSIMKLSELMRYVLYEKEDEQHRVSLDKEIRHINSYIDLEKLRHAGDIYIDFSIEGEVNGKRVAPLLLFPLIENACKHGTLTDPEKPVNIQLKIMDHQLHFTIENYINTYLKDKVGGIGLQNVQKRLELLYNKNCSFEVSQTDDRFIVNLQLPL